MYRLRQTLLAEPGPVLCGESQQGAASLTPASRHDYSASCGGAALRCAARGRRCPEPL